MPEFTPISNIHDLAMQDSAEMIEGYRAGLDAAPEPGSDKSRAFWHGWRNGMTDKGRQPIDQAQRELAEQIVRKNRAH